MTQQNNGVVSKNFYNIRKNRVAYLDIKWKRQKDLQFGRLVVVVVVGVLVVVVVVVVVVAKEGKDTQNTQNKKEQRMKSDKKNCGLLAISSFISRERTLFCLMW